METGDTDEEDDDDDSGSWHTDEGSEVGEEMDLNEKEVSALSIPFSLVVLSSAF